MDRDRRNQMILVVLMTVLAVAVIYSTLIGWLDNQIRQETTRLAESESELQKLASELHDSRAAFEQAARDAELLRQWESRLPQDSAYAWLLGELEPVAKTNGVTEFALGGVSSKALSFPVGLGFEGVKGTVFGVGAYQQLGKFMADFENAFPFNEVTLLNLDVAGMGTGLMISDRDYPVLGMRMEFRGCGFNPVFQ